MTEREIVIGDTTLQVWDKLTAGAVEFHAVARHGSMVEHLRMPKTLHDFDAACDHAVATVSPDALARAERKANA